MSDGQQETKAEKFVRLRDARLHRVLDAIRILGNISNRKDYDYTEAQAEEVVDALYERVDEVAENFGLAPRVKAPTGVPAPEKAPPERPAEPAPSPRTASGKGGKTDPGAWSNEDLQQAGPRLGRAMEALIDGDDATALVLLKQVMAT